MLITECRLWKIALLVLIFSAIALIITGGVLSKYAKDHNTCPESKTSCSSCPVCKLQFEQENIKDEYRNFKIKPYFLEKSFLAEYNKTPYFVDKPHTSFSYNVDTKTLQNDEGLYVLYRYTEEYNPDINKIYITSLNDYSLGGDPTQIRKEWYMDDNKIFTYPKNSGEKFYAMAIDTVSNQAVLQEDLNNSKNIIFDFVI